MTTNISREKNRHKKGVPSVFQTTLTVDELTAKSSSEVYQLTQLPSNIIVTQALIAVITPANGSTMTINVGFGGGDELIDGVNLKSAASSILSSASSGGTNDNPQVLSRAPEILTVKPYYSGTHTAGEFILIVTYSEYTKQGMGEFTNFVV